MEYDVIDVDMTGNLMRLAEDWREEGRGWDGMGGEKRTGSGMQREFVWCM